MKLYPAVVAAAIGIAQVSAAPYIIAISNNGDNRLAVPVAIPPFRLGHAAAGLVTEGSLTGAAKIRPVGSKMPCGSTAASKGPMFDRMLMFTNRLRTAAGLAPVATHITIIQYSDTFRAPNGDAPRALRPYIFGPSARVKVHEPTSQYQPGRLDPDAPFSEHLYQSLSLLSPWENRVVCFLIGAGLGAILNMFYMIYVGLRRGARDDELEEGHEEEQRTVLFVAPPAYVVDEKAPIDEVAAQPVMPTESH